MVLTLLMVTGCSQSVRESVVVTGQVVEAMELGDRSHEIATEASADLETRAWVERRRMWVVVANRAEDRRRIVLRINAPTGMGMFRGWYAASPSVVPRLLEGVPTKLPVIPEPDIESMGEPVAPLWADVYEAPYSLESGQRMIWRFDLAGDLAVHGVQRQ